MSKKITLPSGKILEIDLAPFADANALNKALAKELKQLKLDKDTELNDPEFIKNIFCSVVSSDELMSAIFNCFKRCLYNNAKITNDTFESEEARGDYFVICKEVMIETCRPFTVSLLSQFEGILGVKKI